MAVSLILPKFMIDTFGSEINGLVSSIMQLYLYLSLLEAGIGTTSIQALYKPISENDTLSINSILSATKYYYKKTGIYYLIGILLMAIIYPMIISVQLNYLYVVFLILFTGFSNVISFFFYAKIKVFLIANGNNYIITNIMTLVKLISSITKIVLILAGFSILMVQFSFMIINIIPLFLFLVYMKKKYPSIKFDEKPNFDALKEKNSVLIHQISGLIFSNSDILILSIFLNLKIVSVYSVYLLFYTTVYTLINIIPVSLNHILGQQYNNNIEEFKKTHNVFEFYFMIINFAAFTVVMLYILPFLSLYTSNVNDVSYISYLVALLFTINNLLQAGRAPSLQIINFSQSFTGTRNRAILEMLINLISSLILVRFFGIYGVLIGTTLALLYRANDIIIYANKRVLKRSSFQTYKRWILNFSLFIAIINLSNLFIREYKDYFKILQEVIFIAPIILLIYLLANLLFERKMFASLITIIKKWKSTKKVNN